MIPMRVDMVIASSWSWVTMMKVMPTRSWMLTSSNWVFSRSFLSSAASGSSSSSTLGCLTSALANATRWRWAARQLMGLAAGLGRQAHQVEDLVDPLACFLARHALLAQPEGDVALHRHMGEQGVGLEDHVDRPFVGRHGRHVDPVDQHPAFVRRFKPGDDPQQRRLAAARGAEQREQFALVDVEIGADHRRFAVEGLGHAPDADEGRVVRVGPGFEPRTAGKVPVHRARHSPTGVGAFRSWRRWQCVTTPS